MALHLYAYNGGSEGAKALAEALGIKRIKREGSKYQGGPGKTIINWGSTEMPKQFLGGRVLNDPAVVAVCTNKLSFFETLKDFVPEVRTPQWTTDKAVVRDWLAKGSKVCARTKLRAHSGDGLIIIEPGALDIPNAPLYTRYVAKNDEYRLHFCDGELIDVQRKARRRDVADEDVNWQVRNLAGGFIFQRNDIQLPDDVRVQAERAYKASGLTFGAVDVLVTKTGKAFVLEINTAPGLAGQTVDNYAKALRKYL